MNRTGSLTFKFLSSLIILHPAASIAQDFGSSTHDSMIYTGINLAKYNSVYYSGYLTPFEGSKLANGYVHRFAADYMTYHYTDGSTKVTASAPALGYSAGYRKTTDHYSLGAYLGMQNRYTLLSPGEVHNTEKGNKTSAAITFESRLNLNNSQAALWAGGYASDSNYWTRARYQIGSSIITGPELLIQGNSNFRSNQYGWFVGNFNVGHDWRAMFNLGYSTNNGTDSPFSGGMSLYKYFD